MDLGPRRAVLQGPSIDTTRIARIWFAATGSVVVSGILISCILAGSNSSGHFGTPAARVFNVFCFFTIQSNVLVGVTSFLLVIRLDRNSTWFAALRLVALVGIIITFIVYHVALRHLLDLENWSLLADQIEHNLVPLATIAGWVLFGPRGIASRRTVWLSLMFPALYMAFTVIRGEIVHWYPYSFTDVNSLGYGPVLLNAVWVAIVYLAVAATAAGLDGPIARIQGAKQPLPSPPTTLP
ncbi:MAG TPA: Pr6Pr family membrane protein [Chloroflexota bacterium]|nr:Pr6Pr family membrane protein [Chloroflexota bacterium]